MSKGAKVSEPVTIQVEDGVALTLAELRLFVAWTGGEPDETIVRGTTFVEWSTAPRLKTLTINKGELTP